MGPEHPIPLASPAELASTFRAVFDNASDALLLADDERRYVQVNTAATAILGVPKDELLGLRVDDVFSGNTSETWAHFMAAGTLTGEFPHTRPDGDVRCLAVNARANVAPGRHLSIIRDVTETKRLEEQLFEAQRLESIGRLAGGVAHDFNNLLTAIGGHSDLALARLAPDDPARRHVEAIAQAGARAAAVTSQLLSFSRQQAVRPQVVDANTAIASVEQLLRRLLREDIAVELRLGAGLPVVNIDPGRLEQVLVNLALNAGEAMRDGGTFSIATARTELAGSDGDRPQELAPGTYARITVTDTGGGIAREHLRHIFEPFFTTKEPARGTGLGLAAVHGIVRQSGGSIVARPAPGGGAAFDVYLPSAEHEAGVRPERAPDEPPRGSERILVVEDEELVRGLAAEMLESQGYQVVAAPDGASALDLLARPHEPIDLLFTDVVMPGMSGDDLARESRLARPGLPVLFASGYTDRTIGEEWAVGEHVPFLQKPYSRAAVARKVREVLDATA